ncbi:hypothetical protein B0H17DRAFT_1215095 [Mycena rosella]|uniref:Uncharacterized protein n=1 Tax=Mycena rosella TaxID=1033263 RepID=A0AAD7CLG9_MYCRO|nr:hypothetical protein B0H17DRAFT_1215095 [Mycena rosella]
MSALMLSSVREATVEYTLPANICLPFNFPSKIILPQVPAISEVYNTFDGVGFPACDAVVKVYRPSMVDEMVAIVKNASANGVPNAHMWYDTMCSDDPATVIIKTDAVDGISRCPAVLEAWSSKRVLRSLKPRSRVRFTLVNWNITLGGAIAMGAHRFSLREDSQKSANNDTWLAATTSLGLLGVLARITISVMADYKVWANQTTLDEEAVLNDDIFAQNLAWWPSVKKFHVRTYGVMPVNASGNAFQSTFSVTALEGNLALSLLNNGQNSSTANFVSADIFYALWSAPNFHGTELYPDTLPEWDYSLHGATLELAVPIPQANALLRRVRELFDQSATDGMAVTSTYPSGINIKFGKPFDSFLGQTTQRVGNITGDWSRGSMMFDFRSFLTTTLISEFPIRPHWTKNTRTIFAEALKNLDADSLKRFASVRAEFDPAKTFRSITGEIIGVV